MDVRLVAALVFTTLFSLVWFPVLIQVARARNWVDIPTSRRRHKTPTPIVGGVGIFTAWFVGLGAYAILRPSWFAEHGISVGVFSLTILGLQVVGLLDDLRGLSPRLKLSAEFLLAAFVLACEPSIHATCAEVIGQAPALAQPLLWLAAAVWIVGAANAVNLVDGIDGFAGGVAFLGMVTVIFLHQISGGGSPSPTLLLLCLPGLAIFLTHNWHPAKIFLGDNGSLTLGFLLACAGLMPTKAEHAWTTAGSLLILMAYPIMDMGLCVTRRFVKGYPIFKADRSHLHHRVQRLGLTVPQTTTLLLCAVGFFQFSALLVHLVHSRLAALVAASAVLALVTLLYLIKCLESWRRENLLSRTHEDETNLNVVAGEFHALIEVDLKPLLEVGLFEEQSRAEPLIGALLMHVRRSIRKTDQLTVADQKIKIYLREGGHVLGGRAIVENRVRRRLQEFQKFFGLQYSLDGLPLEAREIRRPVAHV